MRLAPAILAFALATPAFAADPELPPQIDLLSKREELFAKYPAFPDENRMSALRRYGSEVNRYEQLVIGGWQQEIAERCNKAKAYERHVNRKNADGEMAPNDLAEAREAIAAEREQCDSRNRETSPLWRLEAELRAMNTERYEELVKATSECASSETCRTQ